MDRFGRPCRCQLGGTRSIKRENRRHHNPEKFRISGVGCLHQMVRRPFFAMYHSVMSVWNLIRTYIGSHIPRQTDTRYILLGVSMMPRTSEKKCVVLIFCFSCTLGQLGIALRAVSNDELILPRRLDFIGPRREGQR